MSKIIEGIEKGSLKLANISGTLYLTNREGYLISLAPRNIKGELVAKAPKQSELDRYWMQVKSQSRITKKHE